MIILSQDKKEIINFDNVNLIRVQDDGSIVTYDNTYNIQTGVSDSLGKYKTEERAKEILRDIVEMYRKQANKYHLFDINNVYEMPEK